MLSEELKEKSHKIFNFWRTSSIGWAPNSTAKKLSSARLDWLEDLTDSLEIWTNKSYSLTEGELLLACSNLGALVEGWLKLFYCVYYEDYKKNPLKYKGKMIEPNDIRLESLKVFSRKILWEQASEWDKWVERIQQKRNAIHAFNDRYIGTASEFLEDIEKFSEFIEMVDTQLPYPDGF